MGSSDQGGVLFQLQRKDVKKLKKLAHHVGLDRRLTIQDHEHCNRLESYDERDDREFRLPVTV